MRKKMKAPDLIRASDPFKHDDWQFTLNNALITDIRRSDDDDQWSHRISRAFYWLIIGGSKDLRRQLGDSVTARVSMFLHSLKRSKENVPDGYLANGTIITSWCEDGRYIELMQPAVGRLIADFLEQEPANPHAKKIAKKIEQIAYREGAHRHD